MRSTYKLLVELWEFAGGTEREEEHDDVLYTVSDGTMFCVHCEDGWVFRYPLSNIRRIGEKHQV